MKTKITDLPPDTIQKELDSLRKVLDEKIPPKMLDRNLLIATWNIRAFGGLTEKWHSVGEDSPKRDLHSLLCIAEIISRFDVVAVQEVKANLKALRHTLKILGPEWGLILTDVTKGSPGNGERLAFLFDTRKVQLSGLACELVVPKEELDVISQGNLQEQFARTPYAVSFKTGDQTFILVTLHVKYGESKKDRVPELEAIAKWLAGWAKNINKWHHNFIVLGDFNIDRQGDKLYDAFISTGLKIPGDLLNVPRTIISNPENPKKDKFYDQIAWFTENNGKIPALSMKYLKGGYFDVVPHTLNMKKLTEEKLSWHISDHYPLWAEFSLR